MYICTYVFYVHFFIRLELVTRKNNTEYTLPPRDYAQMFIPGVKYEYLEHFTTKQKRCVDFRVEGHVCITKALTPVC